MAVNDTLLTLHLLGAGLVLGIVVLSVFATYRPITNWQEFSFVRFLGSVGAGLAIITGLIMAWRFHIPLKNNWLFITKLILIAADGLIAQAVISRRLKADQTELAMASLRNWAWLSVVIVIAIFAVSVIRTHL